MIKLVNAMTVALCLGLSTLAFSAEEKIAHFELSLADYQVGMTLDEASMVRPFHYFDTRQSNDPDGGLITSGHLDRIFLQNIEFSILVEFHQERIKRIIGRFPADDFDTVKNQFLQILGPAEDRSKVARRVDNSEQRTIHFAWKFPTAKVSLVAASNSITHGTIAIQGIADDLREAPGN